MNEKFEKTFLNSKLLVVSGIIAAILYLAADLPTFFIEKYSWYKFEFLIQMVQVLGIIGLIWAYKKRETNLQKALISGLLFSSFAGTFENLVYFFDDMAIGQTDVYGTVIMLVFSLCSLAILLSHLQMQTEHAGNETPIKVISVAVIVGILANLVDTVLTLKSGVNFGALYLLNNFGEDLFLVMILCIETKIQAYKRIRTEAKAKDEWNDEAKEEAKKIFLV